MVEHVVLFKFSDQTSQEQRDGVVERAATLRSIDGVLDLQCNHNFSNRNQGYSIGLVVRFQDRAALAGYGPSEPHQAFVHYLKDVQVEDTLVVDFDIPS